MRHTRIGSPAKTFPARWQVRVADRSWREEVRELQLFGFQESWDRSAVQEARSHLCEFCGNDMDLRVYIEPELGKHTYAYCTFKGCHWWLEF